RAQPGISFYVESVLYPTERVISVMITDDRKITGDKFVITLPQAWRQAHDLSKGNYVTTMFREGESGPLVMMPKDAKLDELRKGLIVALIDGPSVNEARELSLRLNALATQLDRVAEVVA
ncbi:unnamed protein product, partial [marine sediment metagenome]